MTADSDANAHGAAYAMTSIDNASAHVGAADVTTSVTDEGMVVRRSNRLDAAICIPERKRR